jgi:bleomycin hydrolase
MKLTIQNKLFMKRIESVGMMFLILLAFGTTTVLNAQESYYDLKVEKTVKTTPSKDIQRVNSCWSNVATALIEAEMIRSGKEPVDLSEMDFIHNAYLLKAQAYLNSKGKVNVDEKCIPYDAFKLMDTYGMAPESAYMQSDKDAMDKKSGGEMDAIIRGSLKRSLDQGEDGLSERNQSFVDGALTMHIGDTKMNFTYDGKDYAPKSFAEQAGVNSADYVMLTSDSRQEMNKPFVLELKNNWDKDNFYNVHPNELFKAMKEAIGSGYAVGWYGFVDNEMVYSKEAVAIVPISDMPGAKKEDGKEVHYTYQPLPEKTISEKDRQKNFEVLVNGNYNYMTLYGVSMDKEGNEYILGKDACTAGDKELNMSEEFTKLNTVYLLVNKNGLDKNLRDKLGL